LQIGVVVFTCVDPRRHGKEVRRPPAKKGERVRKAEKGQDGRYLSWGKRRKRGNFFKRTPEGGEVSAVFPQNINLTKGVE